MSEFSNEIVEAAWARAKGACECLYADHGHHNRCGKTLLKAYRGDKFSFFGWEAHSKSGRYLNDISDCEIVCWDPCYLTLLEKSKYSSQQKSAII